MALELIEREYLCLVLSVSSLRAQAEDRGSPLVFELDGRILASGTDAGLSHPTLLVVPVTDALKEVSGLGVVQRSLDRDEVWRVVAFCLDLPTLSELSLDSVEAADLCQAVADLGVRWEVQLLEDVV